MTPQGPDEPTMGMPPAQTSALKRQAGRAMARLIGLVERTCRIVSEPADLKDQLAAAHPIILATWHGQFMMTVHLKPEGVKVAAMVARHGDAELIGEAMAAFGVELIRGAGAGERKKDRGGAQALRAAVTALNGGVGREPASLVMTADVPPGPARRAGEGIITIARMSGRAIVPVAAATTRYKAFKTWSRMTVNLPFGTLAFAAGEPIHVPRDASPETLEALRAELEASLNAATARAYAMAGADPARATPPNPATPPAAPGLLLAAYTAATGAMRPLTGPLLRYRERQGKEDGTRISERRGIAGLPRPAGPLAWIHAASVGETNAILPLIAGLMAARPDLSILLTTTTVTSARIAQQRLPAGAIHQYMPLDAAAYTACFLDHWRPDLAVFTESEIWPGLILATAERAIPLALVNARMSDRSYKSWKRLRAVSEPLFGRFTVILAQNEKLARWFRDCGGRNVAAAGNIKADAPPPPVDRRALDDLRAALVARPRLLAASTHDGEEAIIAQAHMLLAASFPGFCTLIAPRHPDRGAAIAAQLQSLGLTTARRAAGEPLTQETDIYIADTIGELGTLYAACPIAFIGGSLVEHGGQNPLEAIGLGTVALTGPSTRNFRDIYAALAKAGGVVEVKTAADIANETGALQSDSARRAALDANARRALDGMRGALPRTLAALLPLLPPDQAPPVQAGLLHAS